MATYIHLERFRGFRESWIPLRQVNFLVGENSTGKTSFLELLEALSRISFWLMEPNFSGTRLGERHFFDLVSAAEANKTNFTVGAVEIDASSKAGMLVTFRHLNGRAVASRVSVLSSHLAQTFDGLDLQRHSSAPKEVRVRSTRLMAENQNDKLFLKQFASFHSSNRGFNPEPLPLDSSHFPLLMKIPAIRSLMDNSKRFMPLMLANSFVHIAPIRTKAKRTYDEPQTPYSPEGQHVPYLVRRALSGSTSSQAFRQVLESAGRGSGLFKSLAVKTYANDPRAPFQLKVQLDRIGLGLENVGYGVSQSLPVLVEMISRPHGTIFEIQQPEVHLHPRAQATIGEMTAELSRSDRKGFFIETHSDFLIDRFRLNVRKKGAVDSQILFFDRHLQRNRATSIEIGSSGDLDPKQPKKYRQFFMNESLALLS